MKVENSQAGKKKRIRYDWYGFKNSPETHAEMARAEKEMAKTSGSIFTTEDFILFLEKRYNVS